MTDIDPTSRTASSTRTSRRRRGSRTSKALAAATVVLFAAGCTTSLRGDEAAKPARDEGSGGDALTEWPESETITVTPSPTEPDIQIAVHPLVVDDEGTATLIAEVENQGTSDRSLYDLFTSDGLADASIRDPDGRARYRPFLTEDGSCVCSTSTSVPAGRTATVYATFGGVDLAGKTARVTLPPFPPLDGVPVQRIEELTPEATATTFVEARPDHDVRVEGIWRTDAGLLVRIQERNGTDDPLAQYDLVDLADIRVADLDRGRVAFPRSADSEVVGTEGPEDGVIPGRSTTRDLLVAGLPADTSEVVIIASGIRRTLPITVGSDGPSTDLDLDGPLDDPETASLESGPVKEPGEPIALAEIDRPDASATGPAFDPGPVVDILTSPAQPGWSVAPRSVVRTGDEQAVLFLDLTRTATEGSWPEDLAGPDGGSALDGIAVVDPDRDQRLGALRGDYQAFGSLQDQGVPEGGTRTVHVGFPAVADGTTSVTVDVPGFGQVTGVPVTDAPDPAGAEAPVKASSPIEGDADLRIDVLAIGRLDGESGTLVRLRSVNVSDPDAVDAPFVGQAGCELQLVDPDTNRRFDALDPCVATGWTAPLGNGEALEHEVRFPQLPDDVERVMVDGADTFPTPAVTVADEIAPWYLDLPSRAEAPVGDTLQGSVGVADDLQTEVVDGDEVNLQLNTDVLFEFGSADLGPEARARVVAVGERLAGQTSGEMVVTGHTDSVGDDAANQLLSVQRAQAVADVLSEVAEAQFSLTVEGEGEASPIAVNEIDGRDNPDGRARNRRVTITYSAG